MRNTDFQIIFNDGTKIEQIERTCLILYSLFDSLQSNALHCDDTDKFQEIAISFSQFGRAFIDSIHSNISDFIEPDEDEDFPSVADAPEPDDLAVSLSQVLNNPNLPITLYNSLQNAIAEAYSGGDGGILNQFESSPEFLQAVIKSCRKDEN